MSESTFPHGILCREHLVSRLIRFACSAAPCERKLSPAITLTESLSGTGSSLAKFKMSETSSQSDSLSVVAHECYLLTCSCETKKYRATSGLPFLTVPSATQKRSARSSPAVEYRGRQQIPAMFLVPIFAEAIPDVTGCILPAHARGVSQTHQSTRKTI
jgi:hypothetical protein